jgi:hypothetical protein
VPAWRTGGCPAFVQPEDLSILRPVVRVVAAHLPLHLLQHISGWPPEVCATGAALVACGGPSCPGVCPPRLQGQRTAWTVGTEGVGDNPLEGGVLDLDSIASNRQAKSIAIDK